MNFESLLSDLDQARKTWMELYGFLKNGKYDLTEPRSALDQQSVEDFHQRAIAIFEGLLAIQPSDQHCLQAAMFAGRANEIRQGLQSFNQFGQSILGSFRPYWRDGARITDSNNNFSLQIFDGETNIASFDSSSNFAQMLPPLNLLTTNLALLLPFCKSDSVADLSKRANALGDLIRDAENLRNQVGQFAKATEQTANMSSEKANVFQGLISQAEAVISKLQAIQQQATTDSANVTNLVETIKQIGGNAAKLEELVYGYQSKFDAFQKQLDDRHASFGKFEEETKAALAINTKRDTEIDRLIKLSDAMITGATTAGLSSSLEITRVRYQKRMNGARLGFLFSVFLLLLSAFPLAAHLLPGLFGSWIPAFDAKADGSPYAVIGKVVLLLPASWLTAFFTKSYADFFHLEREYAHKAALAMSVDGFKRQAENYQQEITAEVFMEIRSNPASKNAPDPVSHPLYDILAKTVSKVLDRKLSDDDKDKKDK
jgi:hypothetical protein